jgi:hypothetical protein
MIRIRPSHPLYPVIDGLQTMLIVSLNAHMHVYGAAVDRIYPAQELREMAGDWLAELEDLFDRVEAQNS